MPGQRQMQMAALQQGGAHARPVVPATSAPFYATPAFQNHIEQLEQEYDAAADMMEDPEAPDTPGPGPYPSYSNEPQAMSLPSPVTTASSAGQHIAGQSPIDGVTHAQQPQYPSMTQLLDSQYDFDPFGLSASMAFPTQFSFDTSNMR